MFDSAAEVIADELLYVTGKSLLARDFDSFASCFSLPTMLETKDGRRLVRTSEELSEVFTTVCDFHKKNGVVDLARTIVNSTFLDSDTIGSTHAACLIKADGRALRSPYPVYSVIRRFGRQWKIVSSLYAILDSPELNAALVRVPDPKLARDGDD